MRLIGFMAGLTLGGLGLLVLVSPPLAIRARAIVVESLREPLTPMVAPAPVVGASNRRTRGDGADGPVPPAPVPGAGSVAEPGSESGEVAPRSPAPAPPSPRNEPAPMASPPEPASEPRQWHAVWSPFLTARAARGFADRLGILTGLEFTVIEIEPRQHQVAFPYTDAGQRDTALGLIEARTGLKLEENER